MVISALAAENLQNLSYWSQDPTSFSIVAQYLWSLQQENIYSSHSNTDK